jgi:hypothetical protein
MYGIRSIVDIYIPKHGSEVHNLRIETCQVFRVPSWLFHVGYCQISAASSLEIDSFLGGVATGGVVGRRTEVFDREYVIVLGSTNMNCFWPFPVSFAAFIWLPVCIVSLLKRL